MLDVVGEDELQLLGTREVPHHDRHLDHADLARRRESTMTRDNCALRGDEQWLEDAAWDACAVMEAANSRIRPGSLCVGLRRASERGENSHNQQPAPDRALPSRSLRNAIRGAQRTGVAPEVDWT